MPQVQYSVYDVFTRVVLSGNQLGVVHDASGLSDEMMQNIAGELNLSETIFFLPPQDKAHTARVRIFMPRGELPFAGHPTVGGAIARAHRDHLASGTIILEEGIGPVHCRVNAGLSSGSAEFTVPRKPVQLDFAGTVEDVAAASGIDHWQIGQGGHSLSIWSAGVPYLMVPVASLDVLAHVAVDPARYADLDVHHEGKISGAYFFVRTAECTYQVRMFAPWDGIQEDPATGSAAAAFAGVVAKFDGLADGNHAVSITQGVEMGRRSEIGLTINMNGGRLREARISGEAVKVAEGTLLLPD